MIERSSILNNNLFSRPIADARLARSVSDTNDRAPSLIHRDRSNQKWLLSVVVVVLLADGMKSKTIVSHLSLSNHDAHRRYKSACLMTVDSVFDPR